MPLWFVHIFTIADTFGDSPPFDIPQERGGNGRDNNALDAPVANSKLVNNSKYKIEIMAQGKQSKSQQEKGDRIVYSEFGPTNNSEAIAREVKELPPNQQNLRVQASRKGRKGKTVTTISGFQQEPESLTELLKKLKTQCGAGGTVKENTIEIQGEHTQKLLEILTNMGYKAKISGR